VIALAWAPLGAAVFHIIEEFFVPGGFAAWDRMYRPEHAATITKRFHIIINALLLILAYDAAVMIGKPYGVALWLTVASLLATNGIWHVVGAYRTKTYSPGMVTGLLLYVPIAVYGYADYVRTGRASLATAGIALFLGASYQLWMSKAIHRWRARGRKS
jgi:hypothetical protein